MNKVSFFQHMPMLSAFFLFTQVQLPMQNTYLSSQGELTQTVQLICQSLSYLTFRHSPENHYIKRFFPLLDQSYCIYLTRKTVDGGREHNLLSTMGAVMPASCSVCLLAMPRWHRRRAIQLTVAVSLARLELSF